MSAPFALELDGVEAALGARVVLRDVTARLRPGELVAIVGANGAGKTTLVRLMAGLLPATRGVVRLDGEALGGRARRAVAQRLGYLPQQYELAFPFSVREVVLMGRTPHRPGPWLDDARDHAAADEAMARFAVGPLADRRFDELSGGEQRRVLLALAACQGATTWLLDEPTAALDPAHARDVLAALRALVDDGRHAVVVVTHDLNLALQHATTMWLVADGTVALHGSPAEVVASPALAAALGVALHVGALPSGRPFVVPA